MADERLPKRGTRRLSETQAMERVLERQVRRVEENPEASADRRAAAGELRRLTETIRKRVAGVEPAADPAPDSETE